MKLVHFLVAFSFCAACSLFACEHESPLGEPTYVKEVNILTCGKCSSVMLTCKDCDLVSECACKDDADTFIADCGCKKGKNQFSSSCIEVETQDLSCSIIGCGCIGEGSEEPLFQI